MALEPHQGWKLSLRLVCVSLDPETLELILLPPGKGAAPALQWEGCSASAAALGAGVFMGYRAEGLGTEQNRTTRLEGSSPAPTPQLNRVPHPGFL